MEREDGASEGASIGVASGGLKVVALMSKGNKVSAAWGARVGDDGGLAAGDLVEATCAQEEDDLDLVLSGVPGEGGEGFDPAETRLAQEKELGAEQESDIGYRRRLEEERGRCGPF